MAELEPHHDGSALYVSDLRPSPGDTVSVRVRVPHPHDPAARVTGVHVRTAPDGEQHFVDARVAHQDDHDTWWQADLVCHNPVTHYRFLLDGDSSRGYGYRWLNGTGLHGRDVPDAADFRIVTHRPPPEWAQSAVVYQVFPDRFARDQAAGALQAPAWATASAWDAPVHLDRHRGPRQLFGGTLDGVTEHLDHLVDLGVTVLYLTPFFPARSNHRYDAATFDEVDPLLGGTPALLRLQQAAHERGLRVMGDITTNHTGNEHEWFVAARRDPDGPAGRWYVRDPESVHDGFVTWLNVPSLPKLDHTSPELREAMYGAPDSAIRRWLAPGAGLDAWRVDVANMTGRYAATDVALEVAREVRRAVEESTDGEGLLVAEHTHDHSADAQGDGWHGVMNYSGFTRPLWTWLRDHGFAPKFLGSPLRVPRLGGELVAQTMREFSAIVPWRSWTHSFTLAGSHDTTRVRTLVGADGRGQVEVAAGLLLTMPGIPMITYGDEIGMPGDFGEAGRRPMPWQARGTDPALWDEELYAVYRALIAARRTHPALSSGGMRWLHAEEDALVFLRESPEQTALVHLARDAHRAVTIDLAGLGGAEHGHTAYGPPPGVGEQALELGADGPLVRIWTWTPQVPVWAPPQRPPAQVHVLPDSPEGAAVADLTEAGMEPEPQTAGAGR